MRGKVCIKNALLQCSQWILPLALFSGIFLMFSYILELLGGGNIVENLGEITVLGRIFLSLSTLIKELFLPIISAVITFKISGIYSLPSGFLGGYMCALGYSLISPQGSITSASGIFGAIIVGIFAAFSFTKSKKLFSKYINDDMLLFSSCGISLILTILFSLAVNSLWGLGAYYLSFPLGYLAAQDSPLSYFLSGMLVNLNPGSAFYVSAISVSGAMATVGYEVLLGALFSALSVPVVSLFISALVFPEEFSKPEWFTYVFGVLLGFGGISVTAIPYYIKHPFRASASFSLGGIMAALLSLRYSGGAWGITGGFLTSKLENPILTGLIIVCSAFFSSTVNALMGYFSHPSPQQKFHILAFVRAKKASD